MKKHILIEIETNQIVLVPKSVINWLRVHDTFIDEDGDEFFVVNDIIYGYLGKFKVNSI